MYSKALLVALPAIALADNLLDDIVSGAGSVFNGATSNVASGFDHATSKIVSGFDHATSNAASDLSRIQSDFSAGNNPSAASGSDSNEDGGSDTSGAAQLAGPLSTAAVAAALAFAQLF
ncbi:hypothetical protein IWW55_001286 [Coemansia sp. RSA 2706]|nr:hypothetical protein LPJ70_003908 [Coemansia sp. RSA 2708]KAJ2306785.1 hypothetical protein IWW55_001286 [Coemansia sp. RSA 2706]KAJ2314532.1 hypothetical protein IWW54_000863 [Coemansia sp. RSA 2705]KAJ2322787.1 hypothetical protein IWW51_004070 [Coemansia sp. RSA 2702]KAJ2369260.1 hypothetical protein H4S01_001110 [Coemansia sp. RSA 2610]